MIFSSVRLRMADQQDGGFDNLGEIVRRDVGRHPDRDTGRAVDQQVRNARRKNFRLEFALVVIRAEIDRLFVDIFQQPGGDARKPGFGVPHRRGRIAIDRTEIALPIHQRIAHRERLGHADQRVVNRSVAVRMELAENFADDLGALPGRAVRSETHLAHTEENAAMDGFQAVADIRQGSSHDYAHRVIHVRALHLVFDIDVDIAVVIVATAPCRKRYLRRRRRTLRRITLICHVLCLNPIVPWI